jgi:DNA polymerase-3 subunit gamma/tau
MQAEAPAAPAAAAPAVAMPPPAPKAPPPWEQPQAVAATQAPQAQAAEYDEGDAGEEPPSWVTEFSDDTAVAQDAPAVVVQPVAARAPAMPKPAYVITPVPELDWDGNWPALASQLPLRGVAQQLAFQTELVACVPDGAVATFKLRVPIDTLRASGNTEKLQAALQERFSPTKIHVEIDIGQVWYTASVEAIAYREACQREAEDIVMNDPFVKDVMRDLGAFIVPGSVRPAQGGAAA